MRPILLTLCAAILAGCWGDGRDTGGCTKPAAYAAAQDAVKRRLKAPATAVFPAIAPGPGHSNTQVIIARKADCTFGVSAHVDAQNGFGALIRSRFSGTLELDETTGQWRVVELFMAPQ